MNLKFAPYSFSKIATFKCPFKFKLTYIDKLKFPSTNINLEKGRYIHKYLENYILKKEEPEFKFELSSKQNIENYKKIVKDFINLNSNFFKNLSESVKVEKSFGIKIKDGDLIPCEYFDKKCILRGKIDLIQNNNIIDWKTGKIPLQVKPDQLKLYALWTFLKYPEINKINTNFVYIEQKTVKKFTFYRKDLPSLKKYFISEIKKIENTKDFKKNFSPLCFYCIFYQNKICNGPISTLDEFKNFIK